VDFAPQDDYHNYTVNMSSASIEWFIDGNLVRTLNYADALDGQNFPQTPMRISVGSWAAGDTKLNSPGTVEWAQGATNYQQGPFHMSVKQVSIQDATTGSSYTYGDRSGSYQSIKVAS
jgi:beta-glucanase (GH16 family)